MRRFSSYGPIKSQVQYHAHRKELIDNICSTLIGCERDGNYVYTSAPRQCGKTWLMQEMVHKINQSQKYMAGIFTIERGKKITSEQSILDLFTEKLTEVFGIQFPRITEFKQIAGLFTKTYFKKPAILVIDEFDALNEGFIGDFAAVFRDMFVSRANEGNKPSHEKSCWLHGLALVGVRSVLGIENETGSPFNVQLSMHIPNLTFDEVHGMFKMYQQESGQKVEPEVIESLFNETRGQPGLTCWLGELLTEGFEDYEVDKTRPIDMKAFNFVYTAATMALPNNNILNLISKAKKEPNKTFLLEMFKTGEKLEFTFDNPTINDLYMNGLIDKELNPDGRYYLRFSSPLAQKRIFNYFSNSYFRQMGQLMPPYINLDDIITDTELFIPNLLNLYQTYLQKNKQWLFKNAPRRADMRIYEAVYHFNLYAYLDSFLKNQGGRVFPEFPTGNGKIDLILIYEGKKYGLELKSFTNQRNFYKALKRAGQYGEQLGLQVIYLVSFVQYIDEESRKKFEPHYLDDESKVKVIPIFLETGN